MPFFVKYFNFTQSERVTTSVTRTRGTIGSPWGKLVGIPDLATIYLADEWLPGWLQVRYMIIMFLHEELSVSVGARPRQLVTFS